MHLRLQIRIHPFDAEGQVLDRSPAGYETNLGQREAWVTRIPRTRDGCCGMAASKFGTRKRCRERGSVGKRSAVRGAPQILCGVVVADFSDAAEEAGRPVGIPVVVIRTTETPAFRQLKA